MDEKLSASIDYTLGATYMFDSDVRASKLAIKYLTSSAQAGNRYARKLIDDAEIWQQRNVASMCKDDVMNILASFDQDGSAALSELAAAVFGRGDLSREQLHELLLKKQDKENTAEM